MKLIDSIRVDRSNKNVWKVANHVLQNPNLLDYLFECIKNSDENDQMRFSWCLTKIAETNGELLVPHYDRFLELLDTDPEQGLKRNLVRSLYFVPIPDDYLSYLFDLSCKHFANPGEAIAVRVFSIKLAQKIVKRIPELNPEFQELLISIEDSIITAGLRNAYCKARALNF